MLVELTRGIGLVEKPKIIAHRTQDKRARAGRKIRAFAMVCALLRILCASLSLLFR
jgi:hypothetical protein